MLLDLQRTVSVGGHVDAVTPVGPLEWERGSALEADPVTLKGIVSRVGGGFDFQAHLEGSLSLECVRCLEPFILPVSSDFHLLFVGAQENAHAGEVQIQDGDCDLYACTEGKVDLRDVAREQIYLLIPLKPVCNDRCRGLCPTCGENLTRGACRCGAQPNVRVV